MNRESIDLRVKALEKAEAEGDTHQFHAHVLVFLRDLALEVSELHPEELTMEDIREYREEAKPVTYERMSFMAKVSERDKLAKELVDAIHQERDPYPTHILKLVDQLKEKLNERT